jgi:hypothetical protein
VHQIGVDVLDAQASPQSWILGSTLPIHPMIYKTEMRNRPG